MPPLVLALLSTLAKAGLLGSILGLAKALAIESSIVLEAPHTP